MTDNRLPGEIAPEAEPGDPRQRTLRVLGAGRAETVARLVLGALTPHGREGAGTKELARELRLPLRTVQRGLARLSERGDVVHRGWMWYATVVYVDTTTDPLAILGFQKFQFVVENWREEPPPPCRTARTWALVPGGDAGPFEQARATWRGREVVFRRFPTTGTLTVNVHAEEPVRLEHAGELYGWLESQLGLGRGEATRVTHLEVCSDHEYLRMEPFYVELRELLGKPFEVVPRLARVVYQRKDRLRRENRVWDPREADGSASTVKQVLSELVEGSPVYRAHQIALADMKAELARLEVARLNHETARLDAEAARVTSNGTAQTRRDPGTVEPGAALGEGFG